MLEGPLAVALLMCARALPARRLVFWAGFSRPLAVAGAVLTLGLLFAVSAAGVAAASSSGWTLDPTLPQSIGASLIAHGTARRSAAGRGASLALGQVAALHEWVSGAVAIRVHDWASSLSDERLAAECSRVDRAGGRPRTAQVRAEVRGKRLDELRGGGLLADETRDDLVDYIVNGYVTYEIGKRRA